MEAFLVHYCGTHDPTDRYPAAPRSLDTSANYPPSILPILMIIFFNTSIPLPIEISSRTKICVCGKPRSSPRARNRAINSHERAQIMRRANEVPRQHRREPKTAQFSDFLARPNIVVGITTLFLEKMGVDGPISPTQSISITAGHPPPITSTLSP